MIFPYQGEGCFMQVDTLQNASSIFHVNSPFELMKSVLFWELVPKNGKM